MCADIGANNIKLKDVGANDIKTKDIGANDIKLKIKEYRGLTWVAHGASSELRYSFCYDIRRDKFDRIGNKERKDRCEKRKWDMLTTAEVAESKP